ncbi:MAG: PLP-dependent aminotransferase family protein [Rhodospirillaceae bacterium]
MDWLPALSEWPGPVFTRIVEALAADIASGRLVRGQRLPTHRALAKQLGVDLTTVTRAYGEARRRGLIDAQVGRGTFISETTARAPGLPFRAKIDLSMNIPPQPVEANLEVRIAQGLKAIQDETGFSALLNYQRPGGVETDTAAAARWLRKRIPATDAGRLVIFPGNQSILFNTLLTVTSPGDVVLTEALTFPGVKAAAASLGLRLSGVAMDEEGVMPAALSNACKAHKPKVIYLTPTQHNPTTATMSAKRRAAIAEIVRRSNALLIEDDAYGLLEPNLSPIANEIPESTYLAVGLAKCIAPALRVSYLLAPDAAAAERMRQSLQATALMPPPLMVALASEWLRSGVADRIIGAIRAEARGRQALAARVLKDLSYRARPNAHHLWLPMPPHWPRTEFVAHCVRQGLAVVGDEAFAVADSAPSGVRVSLGAARNRGDLVQALQFMAETLSSTRHAPPIV